jgi:hypothetical protein
VSLVGLRGRFRKFRHLTLLPMGHCRTILVIILRTDRTIGLGKGMQNPDTSQGSGFGIITYFLESSRNKLRLFNVKAPDL